MSPKAADSSDCQNSSVLLQILLILGPGKAGLHIPAVTRKQSSCLR